MRPFFDVVTSGNAVGLTWQYDELLRQLYGSKWLRSLWHVEKALVEIARRPESELVLLMFTEDKKLIGTAQATFSLRPPGPKAYVNSVVVDEVYRGKQLGIFLMDELHLRIKEKWPEATAVQLTSAPQRNTQRFYTSLGYRMRTKEGGDETIVYVRGL